MTPDHGAGLRLQSPSSPLEVRLGRQLSMLYSSIGLALPSLVKGPTRSYLVSINLKALLTDNNNNKKNSLMRKFQGFQSSCPEPGKKINVSFLFFFFSFLEAQPRASICESVECAEIGTVLLTRLCCCFSSDEQGLVLLEPQELLCLCQTNTFFISF